MQFSKNFLEFGPCLPHSEGDEQEIVISNPTDYPIEIYSVEFDNTYIEEEKVCLYSHETFVEIYTEMLLVIILLQLLFFRHCICKGAQSETEDFSRKKGVVPRTSWGGG